jgi:hypothetical protein
MNSFVCFDNWKASRGVADSDRRSADAERTSSFRAIIGLLFEISASSVSESTTTSQTSPFMIGSVLYELLDSLVLLVLEDMKGTLSSASVSGMMWGESLEAGLLLTAAKKVTTEEIKRDVNVILNCATFLQVRFAMVANSYINLMGTCLV